jgi:hypothetical protein
MSSAPGMSEGVGTGSGHRPAGGKSGLPTVTIVVGGRWSAGGVVDGDRRAPRALALRDGPVQVGRDPDSDIRLPDADRRVSGVAAVLQAIGDDVKLQVTNRPGAVLFAADGHVRDFAMEREIAGVLGRPAVLVYDGDILWLPHGPLGQREGGYWLEFRFPRSSASQTDPSPDAGSRLAAATTVLEVQVKGETFDIQLNPAQRVILTAVYAEWVAPIPGTTYRHASTADEVAAMVWSVPEYRYSKPDVIEPTTKIIQSRIDTLRRRLESETRTRLPDDPGMPLNHRLALWCDQWVPKSWFDIDLATRLLAGRPDLRPSDRSSRTSDG